MMRRLVAVFAVVTAVSMSSTVAAYLKLGAKVGDRVVSIRWGSQPVRYMITNRDVPGASAPDLQRAVAQAFVAWAGAPGVAIGGEFAGFTSAEPVTGDGVSTIGFRARPDLDRVLGATTFTLDSVTGQILESDIFLNSAANWSVAVNGEPQRYDVGSITTHEIGHLLGLGHSAIGETTLLPSGGRSIRGKGAVMFPIAFPPGNVRDRALEPDDVAGIQDIYAASSAKRQLGAISGRVTLGGTGVFGAHVVAFNPRSGALVGGFSLGNDGEFVVAGLEPGLYVVRAEPLDDVDVASFLEDTSSVQVNFQPAYASSLIAVPAGGTGAAGQIRVTAK